MKLRWKKHPKETGLMAVGSGPYVGSDYHDGETVYATVYPDGGNWRKPLQGGYFVSSFDGHYANTCGDLADSEAEAKAQAKEFVKSIRAR
jgi:hypothetical protein